MRIGHLGVLVLGLAVPCSAASKVKAHSNEVLTMDDEKSDTPGWYGGVGLGSFSFDITGAGVNESFSAFGGYGQLGYAFSENLALEARLGATGNDTRNLVSDPAVFGAAVPFSLDVQADHFFSALLRASTSELGSGFKIYGLLGGTSIKSSVKFAVLGVPLLDASSSDTSLTYGAGVENQITDQLSVGVEYIRYYEDTSSGVKETIDGVTGVARFKF